MTPAEFSELVDRSVTDYAADHVRAGTWAEADGHARASSELEALLPGGLESDGMLLMTGADEHGHPVGTVWLSLTHPSGPLHTGYIYDIWIRPEHRGSGLGRALLSAAEDELRTRGLSSVALNVFADNDAARSLYQSAGYEAITVQMRKPLRPPASA